MMGDRRKAILNQYPATPVVLVDGVTGAAVSSLGLAAGTEVSAVIKGSNGEVDERGLHANRPLATARAVGSTYWSVDEPAAPGTVYVTDGAAWAVLTVL
jgi:hypothetical protein